MRLLSISASILMTGITIGFVAGVASKPVLDWLLGQDADKDGKASLSLQKARRLKEELTSDIPIPS